ncbi:hypothetical protein Daus18300_011636 [Diaporthe australafricana]|uniref:Beta-xylosidase C-terminal Concanavalin A-like domain-containing protein n=1 Tax=Diaporthe australafricana TaxID=127596 RepID=A0ABR3W5R1_9PEZI
MAANGQITYHNPIIPGFAPDPSVLPIYSSIDLQDWELIGLFAPTLRHHKGTFYIVCTNCFHHEDAWRYENFLVSCKDISSGTWSDPMFFPFQGIDPDLFFDDDGRVYVQGSWQMDRLKQPSCTIKQFEIDVTSGKPLSEPREIWGGFARYDTEGPHIYKRGEWYYLLVAEGGTFEHHLLSIARSRNVAGPYESFVENPILTSDGKNEYIQNVGHGDLFQDEHESWWAIVLGVRNEPGQPLGRESFLAPVDWPEGGWPRVSQPVMKFDRHTVFGSGFKHQTSREEREYCYIRNPDLSHYCLGGETGHSITLRATPNSLSTPTGTMSFIGKRQRSMTSVATAILDLPNMSENKADLVAGLALYKDHLRHASVAYNSSASQVQLDVSNSASDIRYTESREIASNTGKIGFMIVALPEKYVFFFRDESASAGNWVELGCLDVQNFYAREFTGPIYGIFATGENREVVFRDFVVES